MPVQFIKKEFILYQGVWIYYIVYEKGPRVACFIFMCGGDSVPTSCYSSPATVLLSCGSHITSQSRYSRVKCSVCGNSWYQSRDRLFDIPTDSHDLLPAQQSDLDRIARNLARDISPNFMGAYKLYVGNLDWSTTPDDLMNFFQTNAKKDGELGVCDVSVVTGPDGRSRGFAFVTFYDDVDGKLALECNGMECNGRELSVREPNN